MATKATAVHKVKATDNVGQTIRESGRKFAGVVSSECFTFATCGKLGSGLAALLGRSFETVAATWTAFTSGLFVCTKADVDAATSALQLNWPLPLTELMQRTTATTLLFM